MLVRGSCSHGVCFPKEEAWATVCAPCRGFRDWRSHYYYFIIIIMIIIIIFKAIIKAYSPFCCP